MCDLKLIVLVIFSVAAITACGGASGNNGVSNKANSAAAPSSNSAAATTANSNVNSATTTQLDGKQLYTESCQICHRDTGKGGPVTVAGKKLKPADLTAGHSKKHSDDDLVKDIQDGDP